jgi:nitroimidazol reductase NimA-like FMN-containing flavoprotein (pyridoxamine 5'-phosphate oxidase superfamily)
MDLTQEEANEVLLRNRLGRLGSVSDEGAAYVVPISYLYDGDSVYFASLEGQKLRFLRSRPESACLLVDEIDDERSWLTVLVSGTFQELDGLSGEPQIAAAVERARHGPLRHWFEPYVSRDEEANADHRALKICRLQVATVSGRRDRWSWEELEEMVEANKGPI